MSNPTVEDLIEQALKAGGWHGLYNTSIDCGCQIDDLYPCGAWRGDCQAGYRQTDDDDDYAIGPDYTPTKKDLEHNGQTALPIDANCDRCEQHPHHCQNGGSCKRHQPATSLPPFQVQDLARCAYCQTPSNVAVLQDHMRNEWSITCLEDGWSTNARSDLDAAIAEWNAHMRAALCRRMPMKADQRRWLEEQGLEIFAEMSNAGFPLREILSAVLLSGMNLGYQLADRAR